MQHWQALGRPRSESSGTGTGGPRRVGWAWEHRALVTGAFAAVGGAWTAGFRRGELRGPTAGGRWATPCCCSRWATPCWWFFAMGTHLAGTVAFRRWGHRIRLGVGPGSG